MVLSAVGPAAASLVCLLALAIDGESQVETSTLTTGKKMHPNTPGLDRTGTPSLPAKVSEPPPSKGNGEDRAMPLYDGREAASPNAGEVLIWIPRAILFPVNLTLEYLVRWPVLLTMTAVERYSILARIERFFTWRDGKAGIYPTALLDFGLNPAVGALVFWDDLISKGDTLQLQGGFWNDNWINIEARSRSVILRDDSAAIRIRGQYITRPDNILHGVGSNTKGSEADETFFRWERVEAELGLESEIGELSSAGLAVSFRDAKIEEGQDPSFETRGLHQIPEFVAEYRMLGFHTNVIFDSRTEERQFSSGSGGRLELFGEARLNPSDAGLAFITAGGELAGFLDLTSKNHVLGVSVAAAAIGKIGDDPIPFTELIELGGDELMRGFLEGRFRGESAFVATLSYRYPVYSFFDADLHVSIGNTYGSGFDDFSLKRTYLSSGLAFRTNLSRDSSIDLLVGIGSNRLDSDTVELDSFRFSFGLNHGF